MLPVRRQHILFSGQLRCAVNTDRLRFVLFRVRRAFLPVEDVIGAEVNQLRAFLAANFRKNAWRFAVDHESAIALSLAKIDIRECGSIDQHIKAQGTQLSAHVIQIRKIKLRVIEAGNIIFVSIFAHERSTKPPACAKNHNFHQSSVSAVRR